MKFSELKTGQFFRSEFFRPFTQHDTETIYKCLKDSQIFFVNASAVDGGVIVFYSLKSDEQVHLCSDEEAKAQGHEVK